DGRSLNRHFWVFYGAMTNLEYTLSLTDLATGTVKSYRNPPGTLASAGDTSAFPAAPAEAEASLAAAVALPLDSALPGEAVFAPAGSCVPGPRALCLNGGRFR